MRSLDLIPLDLIPLARCHGSDTSNIVANIQYQVGISLVFISHYHISRVQLEHGSDLPAGCNSPFGDGLDTSGSAPCSGNCPSDVHRKRKCPARLHCLLISTCRIGNHQVIPCSFPWFKNTHDIFYNKISACESPNSSKVLH